MRTGGAEGLIHCAMPDLLSMACKVAGEAPWRARPEGMTATCRGCEAGRQRSPSMAAGSVDLGMCMMTESAHMSGEKTETKEPG